MKTNQNEFNNSLKNRSQRILLSGSILVSFGILLVTVGGSWDITNHLLNKPETFFSPPHAFLYSGVAVTLIGAIVSFIGYRKLTNINSNFRLPVRLTILGIVLLIGAGPFDFGWHSNFGLDGLLSPPHLTLIIGMLLCSLGGMFGIVRFLRFNKIKNKFENLHLLPVQIFKFFAIIRNTSCLACKFWTNFIFIFTIFKYSIFQIQSRSIICICNCNYFLSIFDFIDLHYFIQTKRIPIWDYFYYRRIIFVDLRNDCNCT